jgi:phenylalanyl-tRNA synthetase beta chain
MPVPHHRTDIGEGVIGRADLVEEIARIYGYDAIPDTLIADEMPPQWTNVSLVREERVRDILVALGLREQISYRLITPEHEAKLYPAGSSVENNTGYVTLANPLTVDQTSMRHTVLISLLDNAHWNARFTERQAVFEIGNVYLPREGQQLPDEPRRLGILMTGPRRLESWQQDEPQANVDFFDLKGIVEGLLDGLHVSAASFSRAEHPSFHPGRSAQLSVNGKPVGTFGELHPLVAQAFDLTEAPVLAAEFDLETLLANVDDLHKTESLPTTPPVLQDIALVVKDDIPAASVEAVIVRAGGDLLREARLFDVYQGESIPAGHKSLAYSLTYQAPDRTLTDSEVAKVHQRIVRTAERELGAKLRA